MTTFTNESTLRARFALFDEGNTGYLRAHELANVFRSLGWNDINTFHCNNLMQTHFGIGSQPLRLTRPSSADNKKKTTEEEEEGEENKTRGEEKEAKEEADEDEEVSEQEELSSPVNSKPPIAAEEDEEKEKENTDVEDKTEAEELPLNDKPCDKIDVDHFLYLANLVTVPKNSPLECYKSFTIMDFTQSGIISEADLAECAMRIHGSTLSVKQRERLVKSVMTVADVNEDGLLSLPEYRGAAAKGGAGTEDGPLDLAFFVVDQPPKPANTFGDGTNGGGRRVSGASSMTHNNNNQLANNASFTSSRSRQSRRGSNAATTTNASYPHGNVVNTIPGFYDDNNNNNNRDGDGAEVDEGDDDANGGLSTSPAPLSEADTKEHKETFNFEGIDVTFTDGRISKDDVAAFFVSCGDLLTGEDFERWFAVEDDDEDGFLSEEQFRSTLEIFLGEGGDDDEGREDIIEGDNFLVDA